jgi:hypothetical protein
LRQCRDGIKLDNFEASSALNVKQKDRQRNPLVKGRKVELGEADKLKSNGVQSLLERNFFHNHKGSLSKTVTAISERLGSNAMDQVHRVILPNIHAQVEAHFRESIVAALGTHPKGVDQQDKFRIKEELLSEIVELAQQQRLSFPGKVLNIIETDAEGKIDQACDLMLPPDIRDATRRVCKRIAVKKTKNHVLQWVNENATESMLINLIIRQKRALNNLFCLPCRTFQEKF